MHDDGVCALALARLRFQSYALFQISGGGAEPMAPAVTYNGQQVDPEVLAMLRAGL